MEENQSENENEETGQSDFVLKMEKECLFLIFLKIFPLILTGQHIPAKNEFRPLTRPAYFKFF
jgi:hypothetical protein